MAVKIGLVGTGTVGGGCIDILQAHHNDFVKNLGLDLELARVCSLIPEQAEAHHVSDIFTLDYHDIIHDPSIQIVIELIGGTGVAKSIITEALAAGKHVVTANKALLATFGDQILTQAQEQGLEVAFEASVGGGIPIIRPLMHSLTANSITNIMGIVNGTTNFMLTRMGEGMSYADALAQAQSLGYAEADPTADVDGFDAAAKIAILSSLAYKQLVTLDDVTPEGIRKLDAVDLEYARQLGYCAKLLAIGNRTQNGIDVRVHPALIPLSHPLAQVNGVMNAIYVVGDFVGETMYYGAGAGSHPTASAVISDVIEIARHIEFNCEPLTAKPWNKKAELADAQELTFEYYLRVPVNAAAQITPQNLGDAFAAHGIQPKELPVSCESSAQNGFAQFILTTEPAAQKKLQDALTALLAEGTIATEPTVIRFIS